MDYRLLGILCVLHAENIICVYLHWEYYALSHIVFWNFLFLHVLLNEHHHNYCIAYIIIPSDFLPFAFSLRIILYQSVIKKTQRTKYILYMLLRERNKTDLVSKRMIVCDNQIL